MVSFHAWLWGALAIESIQPCAVYVKTRAETVVSCGTNDAGADIRKHLVSS